MTTQSEFNSTDLVLRMVNGTRKGSLFPVSTQKCMLAHDISQPNHENSHCAILRGPGGTAIQSRGIEVTINGKQVENEWLKDGDQIQVGETMLEVVQLGCYSCDESDEAVSKPTTDTEQVNHGSETHAALTDTEQSNHGSETHATLADNRKVEHFDPELQKTEIEQAQVSHRPASPCDTGERIYSPVAGNDFATSPDETQAVAVQPQARKLEPSFGNTELADVFATHEKKLLASPNEAARDHESDRDNNPVKEDEVTLELIESALESLSCEDSVNNTEQSKTEELVTEPILGKDFTQNQATIAEEPVVVSEPVIESGNSQNDDDSSVQAYMNRLLGKTGTESVNNDSANSPPKAESVVTQSVTLKKVQPVEFLKASEYKPSKTAPEKSENLNAMRELANQNNRVAINKSKSRRAKTIAITNFGLMAFLFCLGGYLFGQSTGWSDMLTWLGIATIGLSFVVATIGAKALLWAKNPSHQ